MRRHRVTIPKPRPWLTLSSVTYSFPGRSIGKSQLIGSSILLQGYKGALTVAIHNEEEAAKIAAQSLHEVRGLRTFFGWEDEIQ